MSRNREHLDLYTFSGKLVEETTERLYKRHPELKTRYGAAGRERCREDVAYHYSTLAEALLAQDENIFLKYVAWGRSLLLNRKVRIDDLVDCLLLMQEVIEEETPKPTSELANEFIQAALDTFDSFAELPPSCIDPTSSMANLANSYLEALLSGDGEDAAKVVRSAQAAGLNAEAVYQYMLQPVQQEVGRLWQVNQISVAQEHYCTAITQAIMGQVNREPRESQDGRFFVGACIAGEQHSIGIRMVADVMETHGWRVYLTGANTPTPSLLDLVRQSSVQVLGISCATVLHLPAVRHLIAAIRQNPGSTKVLVGGRIFNEFPGLWRKVGADAYAEDATSAVRVVERLVVGRNTVAARR